MSRLNLEDTVLDMVTKMSDGNIGAVGAMSLIINSISEIDPQVAGGGMTTLMILDDWGIYSTSIYILFNDKCDGDTRKFLMLMRAVQLGFLPQETIQKLAADQRREFNLTDEEFEELDKKVCSELVDFQKPIVKE